MMSVTEMGRQLGWGCREELGEAATLSLTAVEPRPWVGGERAQATSARNQVGLSPLSWLSLSLPPAEPCDPEICKAWNVPTTA